MQGDGGYGVLNCGTEIPTLLFEHFVYEWDAMNEKVERVVWVPPCPQKDCDGACVITTVGSITRQRCWDDAIPFQCKFKRYACSTHNQCWNILSDHVQGAVQALLEEEEPTRVHMHPFPFVTSGRSIISERFFSSIIADSMKGRLSTRDIPRRARERWVQECLRRVDYALAEIEALPRERRLAIQESISTLVQWKDGWESVGQFGSNLVNSLLKAWWSDIGERVLAEEQARDERGAGKRLSGDHTYRIGES